MRKSSFGKKHRKKICTQGMWPFQRNREENNFCFAFVVLGEKRQNWKMRV